GAARSYEVGVIQTTPLPQYTAADREQLATHARRAWSLKRSLDSIIETSHAFVLPAELIPSTFLCDPIAVQKQLEALQESVDNAAFSLYGIGTDDRAAIESSGKGS